MGATAPTTGSPLGPGKSVACEKGFLISFHVYLGTGHNCEQTRGQRASSSSKGDSTPAWAWCSSTLTEPSPVKLCPPLQTSALELPCLQVPSCYVRPKGDTYLYRTLPIKNISCTTDGTQPPVGLLPPRASIVRKAVGPSSPIKHFVFSQCRIIQANPTKARAQASIPILTYLLHDLRQRG